MRNPTSRDIYARLLPLINYLGGIAIVAGLSVYAYLGTFSRLLGDDYCFSRLMGTRSFLDAVVARYLKWDGRYSSILFFRLAELFGRLGDTLRAGVILALWLTGLMLLVSEIGHLAGAGRRRGVSLLISGLAVLLVLFQAPTLFQVLYWRSGLVGYTVPLVLMTYTVALILWHVGRPSENLIGVFLACLACFVLVFLTGGTSETAGALQVGIAGVLYVGIGPYVIRNGRRSDIVLLSEALVVALFSMVIMAVAPGNAVRLQTIGATAAALGHAVRLQTLASELLLLTISTLTYSVQFIVDTFRTLPLPSVLSILMPSLIAYVYSNQNAAELPRTASARIWLVMLLVVPVAFVLIAFSFAPSAYAQSYPVERARFPARFIMTLALMAEGIGVGTVIRRALERISAGRIVRLASALLLGVLMVLYPLRMGFAAYASTADYRAWSAAWDERQTLIAAQKAAGVQDIVVPQLAGVEHTKELDSDPNFRINRCAAIVYGVRSIGAPQYGP